MGLSARGMHIPVAEVELQRYEDTDEQAEPEEAAPDARVVPGVERAAPLQRQQQADDSADEEEGAEEIDLLDFLSERHIAVFARRVLEEEEHGQHGDASERQVTITKKMSAPQSPPHSQEYLRTSKNTTSNSPDRSALRRE